MTCVWDGNLDICSVSFEHCLPSLYPDISDGLHGPQVDHRVVHTGVQRHQGSHFQNRVWAYMTLLKFNPVMYQANV